MFSFHLSSCHISQHLKMSHNLIFIYERHTPSQNCRRHISFQMYKTWLCHKVASQGKWRNHQEISMQYTPLLFNVKILYHFRESQKYWSKSSKLIHTCLQASLIKILICFKKPCAAQEQKFTRTDLTVNSVLSVGLRLHIFFNKIWAWLSHHMWAMLTGNASSHT